MNATLNKFTSEQIGEILVKPVQAASLAFNPAVATVVSTKEAAFRIPRITADLSAAWVAEGAEIPSSNATADEIIVRPSKLAALTTASRELIADTTPGAQSILGDSMARDIARQVDTAFVTKPAAGNVVQQAGFESLEGVQAVDADPAAGTDAYVDAIAALEQIGATATAIVTTPAVAASLAKLKTGAGSNMPLLGTDARNAGSRELLGLPIIVHPDVAADTAYVVDASRIMTIVREDSEITADESRYFEFDTVGIRGTMRIGFGFPDERAIVKIAEAAEPTEP